MRPLGAVGAAPALDDDPRFGETVRDFAVEPLVRRSRAAAFVVSDLPR